MRESEFNWFANHPEIMKEYRVEYEAIIGELGGEHCVYYSRSNF